MSIYDTAVTELKHGLEEGENMARKAFRSVAGHSPETALLYTKMLWKHGDELSKFRNRLESDTGLKSAVGSIFGSGNAGGSGPDAELAQLKTLDAMAQQDPGLFKKLNHLLEAPGAADFLKKAAENDGMKAALQNAFSGTADPREGAAALDSLHRQLEDNPDLFNDMLKFSKDSPKAFDTAAALMASSPKEGLEMVGGMKRMGQFWGQIKEMIPPQMMDTLRGFIEAIAPQLDKILSGLGFSGAGKMLTSAIGNDGGKMARQAGLAAEPANNAAKNDPKNENALNKFGAAPAAPGGGSVS